jgi:hypothetical protein
VPEKLIPKMRSTNGRQYAELSHVAGIARDDTRQANSAHPTSAVVNSKHGRGRGKAAAPGKFHNVHQEMAGPGNSPVLVVDVAVDVPFVGRGYKACNLLLEAFCPVYERNANRGTFKRKPQCGITIDLHEVAIVPDQIFLERQRMSKGRAQQHQLGFNPADPGSEHERLDDGTQQEHLIRGARMSRSNIEITNQPFMAFADVIGIAGDVASGAQSTAIQRLNLDEAAEEIGGRAEIPSEAFLPDAYLFFEEGLKRVYRHLRQFYEFRESCFRERRHSPELYVHGRHCGAGSDLLSMQEIADFFCGLTNPLIVLNQAKANEAFPKRAEADAWGHSDMGIGHK